MRDIFAALAPEPPFSALRNVAGEDFDLAVATARWRFHFADAMLEARKK